jgi:hypothetical protein
MSVITSVWGPIIGSDTQSWDADLDSVASQSGLGLLVHTAANTYGIRTLAAPAAGLAITNPAGTAGNPTFALANDLAALEGLASTGLAARSATDTWVQRTIVGTAPITVTNGDGVSGNPTISMEVGPWLPIDMSTGTVTISAPSSGNNWEIVLFIGSSEAVISGNIPFFWNGETTATNYWNQQAMGTNSVASVVEANANNCLIYAGSTAPTGTLAINRVYAPGFNDSTHTKMLTNVLAVVRAAGDGNVGNRVTYRTGAAAGAVNDAMTSLSYTLPNSGTHATGSWGYHRWVNS